MHNDINRYDFKIFLILYGTYFEFDPRTFNYSMPKEGSSGVRGKRNYTLFQAIILCSFKGTYQKFGPDFGPFGPNLGAQNFFYTGC